MIFQITWAWLFYGPGAIICICAPSCTRTFTFMVCRSLSPSWCVVAGTAKWECNARSLVTCLCGHPRLACTNLYGFLLLFLGFLGLGRGIEYMPSRDISTVSGALAAGICDFNTPLISVNSYGRLFTNCCWCIILWTSSSVSLVRGSRDWMLLALHYISRNSLLLSYIPSLKILHQSNSLLFSPKILWAYRAEKRSPILGSKYLIMDEVSSPTSGEVP
jgi:hypothetical protein